MTVVTIGIAGGTGSGKTTLARRLFDNLGGDVNVNYIVHDYYYKDLSTLTLEERAAANFDHPESLETDLLLQHVCCLKEGQACDVPTYDFCNHCRTTQMLAMEPRKIVIVEGILLFCHEELTKHFDIKIYVEADADIRLARRLTRDIQERGRTAEQVIKQYQTTVRPMHEAYVEPSKKVADLIVHSTGHSMEVAIQMLTNHIKTVANI